MKNKYYKMSKRWKDFRLDEYGEPINETSKNKLNEKYNWKEMSTKVDSKDVKNLKQALNAIYWDLNDVGYGDDEIKQFIMNYVNITV